MTSERDSYKERAETAENALRDMDRRLRYRFGYTPEAANEDALSHMAAWWEVWWARRTAERGCVA